MNWGDIAFDWNQVRAFLATVEEGSLSAAARALGLTQPTLGRQVSALEEELGVQLVERSPKNIMLTPVGEEIADRARLVLSDIDQIRAVARRSGNPAEGTMRLGLFPTLAPYLLPHVVPGVRERYPKLKLQLSEEKTEDVLTMLRQGELDAGILALPVNEDGLHKEILFEEPFVMAMPATGCEIGTPASISERQPPHTLAIDELPFDSVMSETMRMV